MSRPVRMILFALLGVLALVVLAVGALVVLVDPNDYREDISKMAREGAGVELKLGGDLGWSFYPVLGFRAHDVGLSLRSDAPQLMQVDAFSVGVRLLPLLSKKIDVDGLDISGLKAHLIVDAKGQTNWQSSAASGDISASDAQAGVPAGTATSPAATEESSSAIPDIRIPKITVRDSQIKYEDQQTKAAYTVDLPLLELTDVNLDEAFPLQLQARVRDNAKLDLDVDLKTQLRADLAGKKFAASDLDLNTTVGGIFAAPVKAVVQGDLQFDQGADKADVKLSKLEFANVQATAQMEASAVSSAPQFKGTLKTDSFDLKALLKTLGIEPPVTSDAAAMTNVKADLAFSGTPEKIRIAPLQLKLDDSTLSGEAAITDVATQALRFNLKLDKLDADRYLPPESADKKSSDKVAAGGAGGSGTAAGASSAPAGDLIPVEPLRGLNINGTFSAGEVVVKKIPVRDIGLSIKALNGDVQVSNLGAKLLQGSLSGSAGVDVRGAQPQIATNIDLQNLQLGDLLQPFVETEVLTGRSSVKLDTRTSGNDMDTLLKQALGQLNLNVADGMLHGVNLNQVVVDALKQKLGDFTLLMPDYETRLPKALKGDTQIRNMLANMKVENGHLITPAMNADTDAGQLNATGDIDMLEQSFDYRFGVVLASLADHKYLKGTEWPVRCKGSAAIPVQDWCRPDMSAFGGVLQKAAGIAMRDKATEKLGEKLGIKGASEAEVKQQAEQKAKEKVNQELGKQLDKLFGGKKDKKEKAPATPAPAPAETTAPAAETPATETPAN
ncbi:MAG: AsmA family protein [Gammaproteobacteria bacterium]|nr:AsmA family protein [Gammaproteobacteria bacterium]